MSDENQPVQAPPSEQTPAAELSPEAVVRIASALREVLSPLGMLRETQDKLFSASMAYMDRLTLLAGGTLTLTFTALATISSHLKDTNQNAVHPGYVITECWLLVATIFLSLVGSRVLIPIRQKTDQQIIVAQVGLISQLRILEANPRADPAKLQEIGKPITDPVLKRLESLLRLCSTAVHLALFGAFVFLAMFIQGNIRALLSLR
jgi:hypothetical protein